MNIALYADGADKAVMVRRYQDKSVAGFTTNPSLMAKAKITDYAAFAKSIIAEIPDAPISFEVFSDDFESMEKEARIIASWGKHVNVKIPITNTRGESSLTLCKKLLSEGMKLNVTALFTEEQISALHSIMTEKDDVIVSIFAGRIADTGIDPMPLMRASVLLFKDKPHAKILWASPREALNIYQADACGCHIITATDDQLSKLALRGKSLSAFSQETVQMFYDDAKRSGFRLSADL